MFIPNFITRSSYPVAVVIPIYKSELTEYERVSLDRCVQVLGTHPIIFFAPEGFAPETIQSLTMHEIRIEYFASNYFEDVKGYSRLLLRPDFYRRFIDYKYILIYQLDAFVFSDRLLEWCGCGYDYIGAPWIDMDFPDIYFDRSIGSFLRYFIKEPRRVGNGGFSLRRVQTALFVLHMLGNQAETWQENEDIFWSVIVPIKLPLLFKIPDVDIAKRFSIELEPRRCFKDNGNRLPFGCHAWEKYDIDFWRPHFKECGYEI